MASEAASGAMHNDGSPELNSPGYGDMHGGTPALGPSPAVLQSHDAVLPEMTEGEKETEKEKEKEKGGPINTDKQHAEDDQEASQRRMEIRPPSCWIKPSLSSNEINDLRQQDCPGQVVALSDHLGIPPTTMNALCVGLGETGGPGHCSIYAVSRVPTAEFGDMLQTLTVAEVSGSANTGTDNEPKWSFRPLTLFEKGKAKDLLKLAKVVFPDEEEEQPAPRRPM